MAAAEGVCPPRLHLLLSAPLLTHSRQVVIKARQRVTVAAAVWEKESSEGAAPPLSSNVRGDFTSAPEVQPSA